MQFKTCRPKKIFIPSPVYHRGLIFLAMFPSLRVIYSWLLVHITRARARVTRYAREYCGRYAKTRDKQIFNF
jgi:hypothetical protein